MRKILVPVDFGELSGLAVEKAVAFAAALGGSVTLLHVCDYSLWGLHGGPGSTIDVARRIREEAEAALDSLLLRYRSNGVALTGVIREGVPWSETLTYATEIAADLIVTGTHGRRGLPRALLGSVAEKIVRFATVPVLTIHGPEAAKIIEKKSKGNASEAGLPRGTTHHDEEVLAVSGAVAGAASGAVAGPPGIVAGSVLGAAVGMAVGRTLDNQDMRNQAHDEELDREIGVSGGDIGAAHPGART